MCGADTLDPLARELYKEHDLSLLRTAYRPDELGPGSIIVTYPMGSNRPPVLYSLAEVVENAPVATFKEAPYRPITLVAKSRALEASAAVQAAGILGEGSDSVAMETALVASSARKFQLSLEAPRRADLNLSQVEQALTTTRLTQTGHALLERGCRINLVTRTVIANQITLEGDGDISLAAILNVPAFVTGEAKAKARSARRIEMQRAESEMVIGFAALRLIDVEDELSLAGLDGPLLVRGEHNPEDHVQYLKAADFTAEDSIFVTIARSDA